MKNVFLIGVTAASMAASYWVGSTYSDARGSLHDNLCLTDRTLVEQIEQNLAETTREDLKHFQISKARWERLRDQDILRIHNFQDASPCEIVVRIPPDIFPSKKGGPNEGQGQEGRRSRARSTELAHSCHG